VEVLKGKKYIEIAYNDLVSDSEVKQVLITAYRKLGLNNQKEFLKKYGYIEIEE
jgi:hypothetical protein